MSQSVGAFVWYELLTTNADTAQSFYADVVGWEISDSGMPNMDYRALNAADGTVGGLMQLAADMIAGGVRPAWHGYIAVENVDAKSEDIAAAGGKILVPPTDIPDVGRFAMIADPQGIPSFIFRAADGAGSTQAFDATANGHCAWNELTTTDLDAALDFYTGQFGWTLGEAMPWTRSRATAPTFCTVHSRCRATMRSSSDRTPRAQCLPWSRSAVELTSEVE